jgi:hypothetical protein
VILKFGDTPNVHSMYLQIYMPKLFVLNNISQSFAEYFVNPSHSMDSVHGVPG